MKVPLPPRDPTTVARACAPAAALVFALACGGGAEAPPAAGARADPGAGPRAAGSDFFVDRAAATGLDFVHFNGMSGELFLSEITCGGGALADFDGDGDLDAYLLQGAMRGQGKTLADALLPPRHPVPLTDRLYRNDLAGRPETLAFTDVTDGLGVDTSGYGCSAAVGDVDNDGLPDLYLGNLGPNQLLRNLGGGRFADVTATAGVAGAESTVTATFFDYDRDGSLDLFVGNNMAFDDSGATVCRSLTGARDYCGPGAYPSEPDRLYRNRGDGTFEDVTRAAGIAAEPPQPTLGSMAADFDGDGWLDLYVANDGQPNHLWRNRGDGSFENVGLLSGAALNAAGAAEASMGVDAGDYDNDGDLDIVITHLVREKNTLYRNEGGGTFTDASMAAGLAGPSLPYTGFGAAWLDYDNDGWLDLLAVNGAVTLIPELVAAGDGFPLHMRNQLFRNRGGAEGGARFEEVSEVAGEAFSLSEVSRGAAFGDVDEDGDEDVLVINNGGPVRLLVNQVGQDAAWVGLRLLDPHGRDALGAVAGVARDARPTLWRRVGTDGSYGAAGDPRALFGLGDGATLTGVEVRWPDGTSERFPAPPLRRYTTLRRGEGEPIGG